MIFSFRMTILPPIDELKVFLDKIEFFHKDFLKKYQD